MKAKQGFASFVTLFSIAVLTLQCAACPAAQHFFMLKCLLRTRARETHKAGCHPTPGGEFKKGEAAASLFFR